MENTDKVVNGLQFMPPSLGAWIAKDIPAEPFRGDVNGGAGTLPENLGQNGELKQVKKAERRRRGRRRRGKDLGCARQNAAILNRRQRKDVAEDSHELLREGGLILRAKRYDAPLGVAAAPCPLLFFESPALPASRLACCVYYQGPARPPE